MLIIVLFLIRYEGDNSILNNRKYGREIKKEKKPKKHLSNGIGLTPTKENIFSIEKIS